LAHHIIIILIIRLANIFNSMGVWHIKLQGPRKTNSLLYLRNNYYNWHNILN